APSEQVDPAIQQLVQMELLVAEADRRGITLSAEDEEEIRTQARSVVNSLIEATGFGEAVRQNAAPAELEAHVNEVIRSIIGGQQPYVQLGPLGIALRDRYPYELNESAFDDVVGALEQIRAQQPMELLPGQIQPLPLEPDADTAAGAPGAQGSSEMDTPAGAPQVTTP